MKASFVVIWLCKVESVPSVHQPESVLFFGKGNKNERHQSIREFGFWIIKIGQLRQRT